MVDIRHNWTVEEVQALFEKPFMDLLFEAQLVHREYHPANEVQVSTLLSIKTGACPEDCKYCPQSAHYRTDIEKERLLEVERVLDAAEKAKSSGATRFCMGAAWKNPKERDMPYLLDMVRGVKSLGLETCMTLGMLNKDQPNHSLKPGWITTTTTSIPPAKITAISLPPGLMMIDWIPLPMSGTRV